MWFVVSKKRHEEALDGWHQEQLGRRKEATELHEKIEDRDARLSSTEREKVLADLESALHMIQDYQRSLSIICAADPYYIKADTLLDKYGLSGDFHKIVAGFQATPHKPTTIEVDHQGKAVGVVNRPADGVITTRVGTEKELIKQTFEDEQKFGDQSYGQEKATLMAERTDEGDRLFFVPQDEKDSPALAAAKTVTEEASR
jgi:hypothetical protein